MSLENWTRRKRQRHKARKTLVKVRANACFGVDSCFGVNLCFGVNSCFGVNLCFGVNSLFWCKFMFWCTVSIFPRKHECLL